MYQFVLCQTLGVRRGLGDGGMGVVYEAEDVAYGWRVAAKFPPAEFSKPIGEYCQFCQFTHPPEVDMLCSLTQPSCDLLNGTAYRLGEKVFSSPA